ncbi:MAG: hypothetical protein GY696_07145 [Gammaproteobacteria bacterium]|nr:hypothetical protein [Gammaproteobacteria bacterium]
MNNMKRFVAVPEDVLKRQEELLNRQNQLMESGAQLREIEASPEALEMTRVQRELRRMLDTSTVPVSKRLQVIDDLMQYYRKLDDARPVITSVQTDDVKTRLVLPKVGDPIDPSNLASKNWPATLVQTLLSKLPPAKRLTGSRFIRALTSNTNVRFNTMGELLAENGEPIPNSRLLELVRYFNTRHNRAPGEAEIALAKMMAAGRHSVNAIGNEQLIPMVYPSGAPQEARTFRQQHVAPRRSSTSATTIRRVIDAKPRRLTFSGPILDVYDESDWETMSYDSFHSADDTPFASKKTEEEKEDSAAFQCHYYWHNNTHSIADDD